MTESKAGGADVLDQRGNRLRSRPGATGNRPDQDAKPKVREWGLFHRV